MLRLGAVLLVILTVFTLSLLPSQKAQRAQAAITNLNATLTNGAEVPPTVPTLTGGGPRPASFGTASFTIVIDASFVFVNVHVTLPPAASVMLAVLVPTVGVALVPVPVALHCRSVNDHPAVAPSITVLAPS